MLLVCAGLGYLGFRVVNNGESVAGALTGPEELFNERIGLQEGQAKNYIFSLSDTRRVEVTVKASPKPVNVYLMTDGDLDAYSRARGKHRSDFPYQQEISDGHVLHMQRSARLRAGSWHIVVERPREALLFGEETGVSVLVVAY